MSDGKLSRRTFIKGAGIATGAAAVLDLASEAAAASPQKWGPGPIAVELTVNGQKRSLKLEPRGTAWVSRGRKLAATAVRAAPVR